MKIMDVFQNSLLAHASYADFKNLDITDEEKVKDQGAGSLERMIRLKTNQIILVIGYKDKQ